MCEYVCLGQNQKVQTQQRQINVFQVIRSFQTQKELKLDASVRNFQIMHVNKND